MLAQKGWRVLGPLVEAYAYCLKINRLRTSFFCYAKMIDSSNEESNPEGGHPASDITDFLPASCAAAGRDPCARHADG
jgi:hypothetical protein